MPSIRVSRASWRRVTASCLRTSTSGAVGRLEKSFGQTSRRRARPGAGSRARVGEPRPAPARTPRPAGRPRRPSPGPPAVDHREGLDLDDRPAAGPEHDHVRLQVGREPADVEPRAAGGRAASRRPARRGGRGARAAAPVRACRPSRPVAPPTSATSRGDLGAGSPSRSRSSRSSSAPPSALTRASKALPRVNANCDWPNGAREARRGRAPPCPPRRRRAARGGRSRGWRRGRRWCARCGRRPGRAAQHVQPVHAALLLRRAGDAAARGGPRDRTNGGRVGYGWPRRPGGAGVRAATGGPSAGGRAGAGVLRVPPARSRARRWSGRHRRPAARIERVVTGRARHRAARRHPARPARSPAPPGLPVAAGDDALFSRSRCHARHSSKGHSQNRVRIVLTGPVACAPDPPPGAAAVSASAAPAAGRPGRRVAWPASRSAARVASPRRGAGSARSARERWPHARQPYASRGRPARRLPAPFRRPSIPGRR